MVREDNWQERRDGLAGEYWAGAIGLESRSHGHFSAPRGLARPRPKISCNSQCSQQCADLQGSMRLPNDRCQNSEREDESASYVSGSSGSVE